MNAGLILSEDTKSLVKEIDWTKYKVCEIQCLHTAVRHRSFHVIQTGVIGEIMVELCTP